MNPVTAGWVPEGTLRAGVQVLHTPDAVGLKGLLGGHPTDLLGRYGASYRNPGGFESTFGAGIVMDGWLLIDGAMTRERAFGGGAWRPAFQVGLVLGRYAVTAARGNGINGLGATYRFAIDVDIAR